MPPRRSVATPASQPIGNVLAAAPTREIKLPPFEEDMLQAWYNQAEAYFRLHGVTDRMFWFFYIQWALTPYRHCRLDELWLSRLLRRDLSCSEGCARPLSPAKQGVLSREAVTGPRLFISFPSLRFLQLSLRFRCAEVGSAT